MNNIKHYASGQIHIISFSAWAHDSSIDDAETRPQASSMMLSIRGSLVLLICHAQHVRPVHFLGVIRAPPKRLNSLAMWKLELSLEDTREDILGQSRSKVTLPSKEG